MTRITSLRESIRLVTVEWFGLATVPFRLLKEKKKRRLLLHRQLTFHFSNLCDGGESPQTPKPVNMKHDIIERRAGISGAINSREYARPMLYRSQEKNRTSTNSDKLRNTFIQH